MMTVNEWIDYVVERGQELCLQRLSDETTYPEIGGDRIFVDYETYAKHSSKGIDRPSNHLIDEWVVNFRRDENELVATITNKKEVGGWNLLKLIEEGTRDYVSTTKKGMTFWYRFQKKWFFNVHKRSGISTYYTHLMGKIQEDVVYESLIDACEEANSRL